MIVQEKQQGYNLQTASRLGDGLSVIIGMA